MTKTYVLAVDPGTTTGLALVYIDEYHEPTVVWSAQLSWNEASDALAFRLRQTQAICAGQEKRVIAVGEKFVVNAKTAQRGGAEDAIGMLGVLRRECRLAGVELAPLQTAQSAKNLVSDEALKAMSLYHKGEKHVNDALRHAVFLAVKRKLMDPRWLIGGPRPGEIRPDA